MTDPVVPGRIQMAVDHEIVPGTLNVSIPDPLNRRLLSSYRPGGEIDSEWEADTGQAGYFWSPALIAGRYRGVVAQADEPDYPQTLIEVLCEVRLRSALGPSDGDGITVSLPED
jgi:CTP-dependent riboflavin kinase